MITRIPLILITSALLFTVLSFAQESNYIKGELIIQFKYEVNVEEFKAGYDDLLLTESRLLSDRMNIWLFSYDAKDKDDVQVRFRVSRDSRVKAVQFNHILTLREETVWDHLFPDDPQFGSQWGLHNTGQSGGTPDADIDAPEAWDIAIGGVTVLGDTIVVAVVDGGCQLDHPDLNQNYWFNWNEIPNNSIDDDSNGYVDDFRGWNAYNNSPNIPNDSHGTHVCGIAGATGNNSTGVSGVNWNVKVMPIAGASSDESTVVAAYAYALELRAQYNETNGQLGAFIVSTNSSFGVDLGQPANYPIWCAMYDSLGVQGILSPCATANANWDIDVVGDIPTACPSDYMVAVTNTTRNDLKNSNAAYGLTTIDLGAPGTSILSTYTGSTYNTLTGTSMATPMVAGAIALMFAASDSSHMLQYKNDPSTGAIMFRDILFDAVDSIAALQGITVTGGRLNVFNAAQLISSPVVPVELVSFTVIPSSNGFLLEWKTATETNNFGFDVEKLKESNLNWEKIAFIAGHGTTTETKNYSFIDDELSGGKYFFRLKQIDYNGAFSYSGIVEADASVPGEFSLEQNYPNPFNPVTKIKFSIPESSIVNLKVYDVIGNEVATLIHEQKDAGFYEVEFNAEKLGSGVYFYTLKAGSRVASKKMILIK